MDTAETEATPRRAKAARAAKAKSTGAKRYSTIAQVAERYQRSESQIWQDVAACRLPAPYRFGPRCTRWSDAELDAHDERLMAARPVLSPPPERAA